jgi:low affinity Fe/Cu permease
MAPTMLDVYTTCLLTLVFLFVIVGIVAIYGRVFQHSQKNQLPSKEDTLMSPNEQGSN